MNQRKRRIKQKPPKLQAKTDIKHKIGHKRPIFPIPVLFRLERNIPQPSALRTQHKPIVWAQALIISSFFPGGMNIPVRVH